MESDGRDSPICDAGVAIEAIHRLGPEIIRASGVPIAH